MQKLISLCKRRGFIFPGSDLYGGLNGTYDYGPLGVQLKKNLTDAWWRRFVTSRRECMGLDSGILLSRKVWEKSGHVAGFVDPLADCRSCKKRSRADHLVEKLLPGKPSQSFEQVRLAAAELEQAGQWKCPHCNTGSLGPPRQFNLLFATRLGPLGDSDETFFRPETAQGAYINLGNLIAHRGHARLPFGVGQTGRVFRNEVNPQNFIFRTREFEQMELQWFCAGEEEEKWHGYWIDECLRFVVDQCGLDPTKLRVRHHAKGELAHYARATADLEYHFEFGWGELCGIANRGDWDLRAHSVLSQFDSSSRVAVIEPSMGTARLLLAMLTNAMSKGDEVLRLPRALAPVQLCVLPVVGNKPDIVAKAEAIYDSLARQWPEVLRFETSGTVGKRYARNDEIGTPYCLTVDSDSLADGSVSVRVRDSGKRVRIGKSVLDGSPTFAHFAAAVDSAATAIASDAV